MPTESIHEKYAKSLKRHATTRKHPLQLKKKSRRGEIQKNKAKGFSGGASAGLPAQALRAATEKAAREGDSVAEKSILEGSVGLEPTTPCLKGRCSNQLSYDPA